MEQARGRALRAGLAAYGAQWTPTEAARAPGRLELLGNHVDYNGGQVLAAAIQRDVVCLVEPRGSAGTIDVVFADRQPDRITSLRIEQLANWTNPHGSAKAADYARGVVATALGRGIAIHERQRLAIAGDVPIGFGLSSSAALCVALTLAIHADEPDPIELVLRAQEAEHRAGTPCGTMDQSASVAGHVILYSGAPLGFTRLEPDLGDYAFAVADSGVGRSLATSSYPRRVEECRRAAAAASEILRKHVPTLAMLENEDLPLLEPALDATLFKRVRHVVSECARVRDGVAAARANDWPAFGALMTASGRSSATDYEISHINVEVLVAESLKVDGVVGARMMGGGDGGAALILLRCSAFDSLVRRLQSGYYARRGVGAASERVLIQTFGPGAERILLANR